MGLRLFYYFNLKLMLIDVLADVFFLGIYWILPVSHPLQLATGKCKFDTGIWYSYTILRVHILYCDHSVGVLY